MQNIGIVILAAATLAGCQTGPSRQEVLSSLVGRPESEALRLLGAPNHLIEANGQRFLAYEDSGVSYVPASPFGAFGGFGFGYYYYPATLPLVRTCVTTLEVSGGRVASWNLRGNACS